MGHALYRGGSADVWKGKYASQDVAVKVMRMYSNSDLRRIIGVSHSLYSVFHDDALLREPHAEVLQRGSDVEDPSPSKRTAISGRDDCRD